MKTLISIPPISHVHELLNFLTEVRGKYLNSHIILSFRNLHFIHPYHIAPLACLVNELINAGNAVEFADIDLIVRSYLEKVGFLDMSNPEYTCDQISEGNSSSKTTYLKLWKVDASQIYPYTIYAVKFYGNNSLSGQNLDALNIGLTEDFNNIVDHSQSAVSGYVITQYYPQKSLLITSICDFGVGIPGKINAYKMSVGELPVADMEALRLAMEVGYSTKTVPHNKGLGLPNVISTIKDLNSSIKIISNGAMYMFENEGVGLIKAVEPNFGGTLIVIKINTNNLPPEEPLSGNELYL